MISSSHDQRKVTRNGRVMSSLPAIRTRDALASPCHSPGSICECDEMGVPRSRTHPATALRETSSAWLRCMLRLHRHSTKSFDCAIEFMRGQQAVYRANVVRLCLEQPGEVMASIAMTCPTTYIGKAGGWLWQRRFTHARRPGGRYGSFWNCCSVLVIRDKEQRDAVASILIASVPNGG